MVDIEENDFANQKFSFWTIGIMYRLKMVDMLPNNIDKVIYLDSDIVVNMDIKYLWENQFLKNKSVLGKRDREIAIDCYINSGILLLNLKKIRQYYNFYGQVKNYLNENPLSKLPDQDAINHVFNNDKDILEDEYNIYIRLDRNKKFYAKGIFHFSGDYPQIFSDYLPDKLYCDIKYYFLVLLV